MDMQDGLSKKFSRRGFLKGAAGLGALAVLGRSRAALATTATDYRALVCLSLAGGCDGNNLVVPLDNARHGAYAAARSALAIPVAKLAATSFTAGNLPYGLHHGLPKLHARYQKGQAALVLNMGNLIQPLTRTEYLSGATRTPSNLFSHSDQTTAIQMGGVPRGDATGWGGRLLDNVSAGNSSLGAISTSSPAAFLVNQNDMGNCVPAGTNLTLAGLNLWPASAGVNRRQAIAGLLSFDGGNLLRASANRAFADGMQLGADLAAASAAKPLTTSFPPTTLGRQLQLVANLIRVRSSQGPGRQVFLAELGGFDTHSGQDWQQWDLFLELDAALEAFQACLENELQLAPNVTTFSLSEFGRTLQSNGLGSDHGWGNHHFVVGGAVRGGLYGQLPVFQLGGVDDAGNRGVWIPKISTEQFAATLGRWFGASDAELAASFESLSSFPVQDLGFMG